MDASKEYIQMCKQASEIQALKTRWEDGDVSASKDDSFKGFAVYVECMRCNDEFSTSNRRRKYEIWLPRQDQLQEVADDVLYQVNAMKFFKFRFKHRYNNSPDGSACNTFSSMEKLWLAFVMMDMYGKVWTGTDWERMTYRDQR